MDWRHEKTGEQKAGWTSRSPYGTADSIFGGAERQNGSNGVPNGVPARRMEFRHAVWSSGTPDGVAPSFLAIRMGTDRRVGLFGFFEVDVFAIGRQQPAGDMPGVAAVGDVVPHGLAGAVRPDFVDREQTVSALDNEAVAARHCG
jgi:hypothetical protein